MIAPDVIETAKRTDLVQLALAYSELRPASGRREWCGPCPKCGGRDRFHVTAEWFFCRQCHEKRGDAIEFARWFKGADFMGAIIWLMGDAPTPAQRIQPEHRCSKPPVWNEGQACARLKAAQNALQSTDGEPGRSYLLRRGLQPATWAAFGLGYEETVSIPGTAGKLRAPAISIPWLAAGQPRAIRYRFLEEQTGHKQAALYGSTFAGLLFGGQMLARCAEELRTLVICEGEINAMSIWQVAHETECDVLSLGSETAKLSPRAIEYASRFRRVIVWADRYEIAQQLMSDLPGAYGIRSPGGKDGNDLLQAGLLGGFLATVRMDAAGESSNELRALYWALYDQGAALDEGSALVRHHLAPKFDYAA